MNQITEEHLDIAIAAAREGRLGGRNYDQSKWCGTSCCVLGFARIAAGLPERNEGPIPGEIVDTPRARMIQALMWNSWPGTLDDIAAVQPDGSISVDGNLDLRELSFLAEGVTIRAGAFIDLRAVSRIPAGVIIEAASYLNLQSTNHIHNDAVLLAGGHIYLDRLKHIGLGVVIRAGRDAYLNQMEEIPDGVTVVAGGNVILGLDRRIRLGISTHYY